MNGFLRGPGLKNAEFPLGRIFDLCTTVAQKLLAASGVAAADLDFILVATMSPIINVLRLHVWSKEESVRPRPLLLI